MPDLLAEVLATPGLVWLVLTISGAGIIRGFTGFGTALIFVPVAGIFLPPAQVVALITLTGVASMAALLPRAWGQAARGEVTILVIAALITVPAGIWLLGLLDPVAVRWIVAGIAATTLAALVSGWRHDRAVRLAGLATIGAMAGIVGGLTGLTGPVVILFYLAGRQAALSVRANTILFLAALDVVIVINLLWRDAVGFDTMILAAFLSVPYFCTTLIGQALFDPARERLYRWAAYGVIGLAVTSGLPLWN
ncbi:sulfite exporter TauE/SafE family protein [Roseovarius sp. TE539]|uniref:sulfite exporter TauE/SafE family protein n=1 Tax=Roseovarius sp. TE539 TaxID=2249812 RepID=UPI000DDFD5BB|nr:sulfite exporter TauE/SafE family protein [Roseovarius sp. TE539]RBI69802.1 sulfite exporter TauE/SafE family protein [Roseovarius sp. TE539]